MSLILLLSGVFNFDCLAQSGGFSFNPVFTHNAVLQRGVEIPVAGIAAPGDEVSVSFKGQRVSTKTGSDGKWSVNLKPMPASIEGRELVAECGENKISITNILVGEVFLCSGQSNMQQPLWSGSWGGGFSDRKGILESKIARWKNFRYTRAPKEGRKADWYNAA